jgi:7-cyano-7-deazaguanine synthase
MKKAVVSLSGGMDSTCLLIELLAQGYGEIKAISFDYGQRHKVELEKASLSVQYLKKKGFNITHNIIDLTTVGALLNSSLTHTKEVPEGHYEDETMKDTVVPNRNIILSSIIYGIALSWATEDRSNVEIAMGVHAGDNQIYPDCRAESIQAVKYAFTISNWDSHLIDYKTPYLILNKEGILLGCLDNCALLGLDFDTILKNTSTTYKPTPDGKSEGKSSSDIERIEAFINIGRTDPAAYTKPWQEIVSHAMSVLDK